MNPHQAYRIKKLQRQLDMAESYEEWKSFALKLDEETGRKSGSLIIVRLTSMPSSFLIVTLY